MRIKKINHIAIHTNALEETVEFYAKTLGFTVSSFSQDDQFHYVFMELDSVCTLELFRSRQSESLADKGQTGVDHLAFDVDNVKAAELELLSQGVELEKPCAELPQFNTRLLMIKDPNGISIALREDLL